MLSMSFRSRNDDFCTKQLSSISSESEGGVGEREKVEIILKSNTSIECIVRSLVQEKIFFSKTVVKCTVISPHLRIYSHCSFLNDFQNTKKRNISFAGHHSHVNIHRIHCNFNSPDIFIDNNCLISLI